MLFRKEKVIKNLVLMMPYALVFYIANKIAETTRYMAVLGMDISRMFINFSKFLFEIAKLHPLPSLQQHDVLYSTIATAFFFCILYIRKQNMKKFRKGVEYGSARFGTSSTIQPYINKNFKENVLLTQTERLTMESRTKIPKYARNKNVLVIGGSGSGKTRYFVKPNLMQMHSSYVITDPKGSILVECGKMLKENGYKIKVLNTVNFKKSMSYNPFAYIKKEEDILQLVEIMLNSKKGANSKSTDDFWGNAERMIYMAYIGYIWYEAPDEEKNFGTLLEMIRASETREDEEDYKNYIDYLFEELEQREPDHFAVGHYREYKLAGAGKTAKSILVSCAARLAPYGLKAVKEIMSKDEMHMELLGEEKTALFIVMSDTNKAFSFLVNMMYSQLFDTLVYIADERCGSRLKLHVRCILDEFANIGKLPNIEMLISTLRSREVSVAIILQALSQIKSLYKDDADTIITNCDSFLFLGSSEKSTLKEVSEKLGKETIDISTTGISKGQSTSNSTNFQRMGRELMTQDELATMDRDLCILQITGEKPFMSKKYDIKQHPNYVLLSDYNRKNIFNIKKEIELAKKKAL